MKIFEVLLALKILVNLPYFLNRLSFRTLLTKQTACTPYFRWIRLFCGSSFVSLWISVSRYLSFVRFKVGFMWTNCVLLNFGLYVRRSWSKRKLIDFWSSLKKFFTLFTKTTDEIFKSYNIEYYLLKIKSRIEEIILSQQSTYLHVNRMTDIKVTA